MTSLIVKFREQRKIINSSNISRHMGQKIRFFLFMGISISYL